MLASCCVQHVKPWRLRHYQRAAPASLLNTRGTGTDGASADAAVRTDLSDGFMVMYSTSSGVG